MRGARTNTTSQVVAPGFGWYCRLAPNSSNCPPLRLIEVSSHVAAMGFADARKIPPEPLSNVRAAAPGLLTTKPRPIPTPPRPNSEALKTVVAVLRGDHSAV